MKKVGFLLLLMAVCALAQQPGTAAEPQVAATNLVERAPTISYADLYCAGFATDQSLQSAGVLVAGWHTPHQTRYADREIVYVSGGGLQAGQQLAVLRRLKNPLRGEVYRGQKGDIGALGDMYAEMGRVRVREVRGNTAIADIEMSCDAMVPGDFVVAWMDKQRPALRAPHGFEKFAPENGKPTGRIVASRDFDSLVGTNRKVYINIGSNQGLKVGDYLRATRQYERSRHDFGDEISLRADPMEPTQKDPREDVRKSLAQLPRISVGEMVVLNVSPRSATGMITYAIEAIQIGDGVEVMEEPPPVPERVAPPAQPPTISCYANPATVRVGDSAQIICEAVSPENRPLTITHAANRGRVVPRDMNATLDTREAGAGPVSVRTVVTDDRNLSAEFITLVNVEPPPPAPVARKVNEVQFRPNSAYVDNRAKAILDDLALAAQREADSTVAVFTGVEGGEAAKVGEQRAQNIARYLTREKGLDTSRVQVSSGMKGRKADLWIVPPGAAVPEPPGTEMQH